MRYYIADCHFFHEQLNDQMDHRGFKDADVPKDEIKRQCYEEGKKKLLAHGYHEIGMDHFALSTDPMYQAFQEKALHRNFMGYTASKT